MAARQRLCALFRAGVNRLSTEPVRTAGASHSCGVARGMVSGASPPHYVLGNRIPAPSLRGCDQASRGFASNSAAPKGTGGVRTAIKHMVIYVKILAPFIIGLLSVSPSRRLLPYLNVHQSTSCASCDCIPELESRTSAQLHKCTQNANSQWAAIFQVGIRPPHQGTAWIIISD
eukprot:9470062-Pyramimonas_sp.AAC.1